MGQLLPEKRMGRFSIDGEYDGVRIIDNPKGATRAFVSFVDLDTGLRYQDWQVCEKGDNLWVSSPRDVYQKSDGKDQWYDLIKPAWDEELDDWDPVGQDWKDELEDFILDIYLEKVEERRTSSRRSRRSGRGPTGGRSGRSKGRNGGSRGKSRGGRSGGRPKSRKRRGGRRRNRRNDPEPEEHYEEDEEFEDDLGFDDADDDLPFS